MREVLRVNSTWIYTEDFTAEAVTLNREKYYENE